jgi:hypothetical protein
MKFSLVHLFSGAALIVASSMSVATTVQFTGYKTGSEYIGINSPIHSGTRAGEFTGMIDGVSFDSFCVDLHQSIWFGQPFQTYQSISFASGNAGFSSMQENRLNRLYSNYLGAARNNSSASAAFQTAVWEITYDGNGSLSLGSGAFKLGNGTNQAARDLAATWLTGLDGKASGNWAFTRLASATHQDQLIAVTGNSSVPIPGTLALMIGGIGIAVATRVRAQKRALTA